MMNDVCEEAIFADDFWRLYIETREAAHQLRDEELAKKFFDERP